MADPIAGTGSRWANGRLDAAAAVGPASCSPRPRVTVGAAPGANKLNVTVSVEGAGNVLRYVQVGGPSGTVNNAALSFPGTTSTAAASTNNGLYVPTAAGTALTFQVTRTHPGEPTTVPFIVYDGCGAWQSFAGGGANAGF
jgi:hypothetical protein